MIINLSDQQFQDKLEVSTENVLSMLNEYDIFRNYLGEFVVGRAFQSPIKAKDDNYSFGVFWSKTTPGKLLFKDLSIGITGNVFRLVSELYGLNYYNSILKVIYDFRLNDKFAIKGDVNIVAQKKKPSLINIESIPKPTDVNIQVRFRKLTIKDVKFWTSFGITRETLIKFNVRPIDYIFLNDKIIKADELAYAYYEKKDGVDRYKIYQPYSKSMKWLSNFVEGTISGWDQMPKTGHSLIITSSLKDTMTLDSAGYISIAPQTETYTFKEHIVNILKERFNEIYIYYDYDEAGIDNAEKNAVKFGFIPIYTEDYEQKDPSDYYREYEKIRITKEVRRG